MPDDTFVEPPLRDRLLLFAYVPALVPLVICRPPSLLGLLMVASVAAAVPRLFDPGVGRPVGGALLATFASLLWVFAKGTGTLAPFSGLVLVVGGLGAAASAFPGFRGYLRGAPVTTALMVILGVVGFYRLAGPALAFPPITDDFLYALRADPVPEPFTADERAAAMAIVDSVLDGTAVPEDVPARLRAAGEGPVYVTLFRPTKRSRWSRGGATADTIADAVRAAATEAWQDAPQRLSWRRADVRVVIDLAGPDHRIRGRALREVATRIVGLFSPSRFKWRFLVYDAEPGVDGFRLRHEGGEGVALPADTMYFGWTTPRNRKKRYRDHNLLALEKALARRARLSSGSAWPNDARLYNFRTYSFARPDPASDRTVELYRGNVLRPELPTEQELLQAIDRAGGWLLGTVEDDGRFDYEYLPNRDHHGRGYNEVRHAGSVYGLFHMAHLARREPSLAATADAYLGAGLTALDRVYRNLDTAPGTDPADGYVAFVEGQDGAKTNSGAAALTLLSFLERPTAQDTDDPVLAARIHRDGDEAIMAGLVKTLLRMIDDRGWVYGKWSQARDGVPLQREPLYYPGEAMLALARYHEQVGDPEALEGAKAIGRRQVGLLDRFWTIPDHWVMQAMDVLDRLDPDEALWREGAYSMGDKFIADQLGPDGGGLRHIAPFPDYRGAYRRVQEVPRTTRAASRGEAVGGVARVAWRRGDPAEHLEESLLEGARHLMEQMYTPDNSFFFPNPEEGLGAIRMGIIDNHIRIDNNQHGIVALGNALDVLRRRAGQAP